MDAAIREHGIDVSRRHGDVTFASYALSWEPTGALNTRLNGRSHARALAQVWPTEKITDITPVMIKAMLHDMDERGLSAGTREGRLSTLRKLFDAAIEHNLRVDNPATAVRDRGRTRTAGGTATSPRTS